MNKLIGTKRHLLQPVAKINKPLNALEAAEVEAKQEGEKFKLMKQYSMRANSFNESLTIDKSMLTDTSVNLDESRMSNAFTRQLSL